MKILGTLYSQAPSPFSKLVELASFQTSEGGREERLANEQSATVDVLSP